MTDLPPQRPPPSALSGPGFVSPFSGLGQPGQSAPSSSEQEANAVSSTDDAALPEDQAGADTAPPDNAETPAVDVPSEDKDDTVDDTSSPGEHPPDAAQNSASVRAREGEPTASAADRSRVPLIPSALELDQLNLPEAVFAEVRELRSRVEHRHAVARDLGLAEHLGVSGGLIALFIGSSESSKAVVAGMLARKGVDGRVGLIVVDLVDALLRLREAFGEEMRSVLARAEGAGAVLYIDGAASFLTAWSMADAEGGNSSRAAALVDLWADLDSHDGVIILAANQRPNIDERALRRIHSIIEFPASDRDPKLRFQLLKAMFPSESLQPPEAELREVAARFRLSEAGFRNVVLDAAARAVAEAEASRPRKPVVISDKHLIKAIALEYKKAGKLVTRGEFGDRYYAWVENDGT